MTGKKSHCSSPEIWGGLECTINRIGNAFRDQLLYTGHYSRNDDIDQFAKLGIKALRYPVLWERHQPKRKDTIDWSFAQHRLGAIKNHRITPIVGLVHHGSGPLFTNLLDKDFAPLLANYARQVASRFPWVKYYTPVNEPLTTARFSGLYGHWYPHHRQLRSFVVMLLYQLKGVVMSMKAIREINPGAQLIQTEDLAKVHSTALLSYQAGFENERRWLTYDLLCGKVDKNHYLWNYLLSAGIKEEEILYFKENTCVPAIMGLNYYVTSERFLDEHILRYPVDQRGGNDFHQYADTEMVRVGQPAGIYNLLKEAWGRYGLPIAITEAHLSCTREEQMRWWYEIWQGACKAKSIGIDIKAVTAWSLLGSYDWSSVLTEYRHQYDPGVFTLRNGGIRTTATAELIQSIATGGDYTHPLLKSRGWWQRNTRLLKPTTESEPVHASAAAPVLIIEMDDIPGNAFTEICAARGIFSISLPKNVSALQVQSAIDEYKPWAIIHAAAHTTIENLYGQSFCDVINEAPASNNNTRHFVHTCLDLLIDGETGTWHLNRDGIIVRDEDAQRRYYKEKII